jgi:hypothetical protein
LISRIVTAADEDIFPVGSIDSHRLQQIGRNHFDTVVIGFGVVDFRFAVIEDGLNHSDRDAGKFACVLEDG